MLWPYDSAGMQLGLQARKWLSPEPPDLPCNVRLIGSELMDCHQKALPEAHAPEALENIRSSASSNDKTP